MTVYDLRGVLFLAGWSVIDDDVEIVVVVVVVEKVKG